MSLQAGSLAVSNHHRPSRLTRQTLTAAVQEHGFGIASSRPTNRHEVVPTGFEPAVHGPPRTTTHRNEPLLLSLAVEPDHAGFEIEVSDGQSTDLGDSRARRVQELEQGAIS